MQILFIGDIFGNAGRKIVRDHMPHLVESHKVDLVIANALLARAHDLVRTLRLTHGLENTYVLLYQ